MQLRGKGVLLAIYVRQPFAPSPVAQVFDHLMLSGGFDTPALLRGDSLQTPPELALELRPARSHSCQVCCERSKVRTTRGCRTQHQLRRLGSFLLGFADAPKEPITLGDKHC
jgi:hypothetical protein